MFKVAIIGGGVVGANIFSALSRRNISAVLLEKNNDVGAETSKANSGLIHAGFDCKPNTNKAKFNVAGNKMMSRLTRELNLPYKQIGALVVGNNMKKLEALKIRGDENGVKDLLILNSEELQTLEPNLNKKIKYGLYAPSAGIISPYMLTIALCEEAILNGGIAYRNFEIASVIKQKTGKFKIFSKNNTQIEAEYIINASGANYNSVAKLLQTEEYPLVYKRGEYYLLDSVTSNYVHHTVFPLPNENSKGILVTPTIDGNIIVGPTSYKSDTVPLTTAQGLEEVRTNALELFPTLPIRKNIRVFAGVRTISGDDFIVEKSKQQNKIINIAGICSPGLSSAPAIAEYVLDLLNLNTPVKKFIRRKNIVALKGKSLSAQNKLIELNPDYGTIVCKCEMVSLAEIKQSLSGPLPALSVDGVKRRVRAGMGRCQSGFCLNKVVEQIAKSLKLPLEQVVKENLGSEVYMCDIRPGKKVRK